MRGRSFSDSCSSRFCDRPGHASHSNTPTAENLPARLGYARNQALRSQLTKSQARYLEAANKSAPASSNLASIHDTRRTGVTRQLRKAGIVLFRLQLST